MQIFYFEKQNNNQQITREKILKDKNIYQLFFTEIKSFFDGRKQEAKPVLSDKVVRLIYEYLV